jgi:hypothetical protein
VRSVAALAARLEPAGVEAVAAVLGALGTLAADNPRVREIDVNPLLVHAGGALALDALVVLDADD